MDGGTADESRERAGNDGEDDSAERNSADGEADADTELWCFPLAVCALGVAAWHSCAERDWVRRGDDDGDTRGAADDGDGFDDDGFSVADVERREDGGRVEDVGLLHADNSALPRLWLMPGEAGAGSILCASGWIRNVHNTRR